MSVVLRRLARCPLTLRSESATARPWLTQRAGFIRDVYRDIEYSAPFTHEEKRLVLQKLNGASTAEELHRAGVTKLLSPHVQRFLERRRELGRGDLHAVEQLLDVAKVDVHRLENLCHRVLKQAVRRGFDAMDLPPSEKADLSRSKLLKYIRPSVEPALWQNTDRVLAVKFSLDSASFARIGKPRGPDESSSCEVLDWGFVDLMSQEGGVNQSRAVYQHHRLYAMARLAVESTAASSPTDGDSGGELVVLEDNPVIRQRDPHLMTKTQLYVLQAALVALLNGGGENRVHALGGAVVDHLFDLRVGQERVKLQAKLPKMLKSVAEPTEAQWRRFHEELPGPAAKEQMGTALLVAVAFASLLK